MSQLETEGLVRPETVQVEVPVAWFCVRAQPKHEHIAAKHLRCMEGVDVFNPRIRFSRSTRQGPAWVTEAMFPSYLFARFNWKTSLTKVHYAPGVRGVVHFGTRWPTVPDQVIHEIRESLGASEIHVVPSEFVPGEDVEISGGTFHGLQAVIMQVMPGRKRVMVLLDFLGRQTPVEVGVSSLIKAGYRR